MAKFVIWAVRGHEAETFHVREEEDPYTNSIDVLLGLPYEAVGVVEAASAYDAFDEASATWAS